MRGPRAFFLLAVAGIGAGIGAQSPRVEVAFAADAATSGLPAVAWLAGTVLPMRDEWPRDLAADQSFVVRLSPAGLSIAPNGVPLPAGALAAGSVEYATGRRALCTCRRDGTEDWYVPRDFSPPVAWLKLARLLRALDVERAHTVDLSVAVGHLLGPTAPGDADREALQLGATLCGEVTWQSWWNTEHLRVRGRSEGGLLLPAVLLVLARHLGNGAAAPLPIRAFAARHGDREEAVRQMSRGDKSDQRVALLAMLHGDDELRLTAIDSLVRLGSVDDLPRIVEAANPSLPLTTIAAADAVAALWHDASSSTKERTREALAASPTSALRNLDPGRIPEKPRGPVTAVTQHWRLLIALFVLAAGLFCLWLRERARAVAFL